MRSLNKSWGHSNVESLKLNVFRTSNSGQISFGKTLAPLTFTMQDVRGLVWQSYPGPVHRNDSGLVRQHDPDPGHQDDPEPGVLDTLGPGRSLLNDRTGLDDHGLPGNPIDALVLDPRHTLAQDFLVAREELPLMMKPNRTPYSMLRRQHPRLT